jgi:osmotically-inducible protein OsmY
MNLSVFPSFAAAAAISVLAACQATPQHRSTGQYIDDAAISTSVKSALIADSEVKARDVQVQTYQGTVQLSGFVDDQKQANRAVEIARSREGVKMVENDLHVRGGE